MEVEKWLNPTRTGTCTEGHSEPTEVKGDLSPNTIVNLSNSCLEQKHIHLLSKGPSFSPTSSMDEFVIYKDIYLFVRRVLFKLILGDTKETAVTAIAKQTAEEDLHALQDLIDLL